MEINTEGQGQSDTKDPELYTGKNYPIIAATDTMPHITIF